MRRKDNPDTVMYRIYRPSGPFDILHIPKAKPFCLPTYMQRYRAVAVDLSYVIMYEKKALKTYTTLVWNIYAFRMRPRVH